MSQTETTLDTPPPPEGLAAKLPRWLLFAAVPLLLLIAGAGLWIQGSIPRALGLRTQPSLQRSKPALVELPEMVANLNSDPRHPRYVKLRAQLETTQDNVAAVNAALPRLVDLFQTYLREIRPEELQGALGTYRLRQELIARASIAVAPAKINDVLFAEILIQ